jgi:hypothetical protein
LRAHNIRAGPRAADAARACPPRMPALLRRSSPMPTVGGRGLVPWALAMAVLGGWLGERAAAEEPLHRRIDALIFAGSGGLPAAAPAEDGEFARRAYLDLAGRIPTSDETRRFLADVSADKRPRLIEALLVGADYPRRMQELFHVMLMERLGDNPHWAAYLRTAFAENRPWNQIVRQVLAGDADDPAAQGAAFFLTKRLENYGQQAIDLPGMTRDVGRLFLGVDLQCAQCHNHLFIDDYKQQDFQGLFAFVGHTFIRGDKQFPAVGERVVRKKVEFMSVFTKEPLATGPRLPGDAEVEIPPVEPGNEFAIPPDPGKNFPGVPRFSPLRILGERLPRAENVQFARNAVNRLWHVMFGRGLVHPLDLHHQGNPPSHPELLDLLAAEFTARGYDIRWMLRELALTEAYGRSGLLPPGTADLPADRFLVYAEKPLSAEQLFHSAALAMGEWAVIEAGLVAQMQAADPRLADLTRDAPGRLDTLIEEQLSAARGAFLAAFANPPREPEVEFSPSVKGALFTLNGETIQAWLQPKPGNLVARLAEMQDAAKIADELYLSVLSRLPADDERELVTEHLAAHGDNRAKAIGQLTWALLASTEFGVNH